MLGPSVTAVKSSSGLPREPPQKRYDFTSFGDPRPRGLRCSRRRPARSHRGLLRAPL